MIEVLTSYQLFTQGVGFVDFGTQIVPINRAAFDRQAVREVFEKIGKLAPAGSKPLISYMTPLATSPWRTDTPDVTNDYLCLRQDPDGIISREVWLYNIGDEALTAHDGAEGADENGEFTKPGWYREVPDSFTLGTDDWHEPLEGRGDAIVGWAELPDMPDEYLPQPEDPELEST